MREQRTPSSTTLETPANARAAFLLRLETEVDPQGCLDPGGTSSGAGVMRLHAGMW